MTEYVSDYMVSIKEDELGWKSEPDKEYAVDEILEIVYGDYDYDFSDLKIDDIENSTTYSIQQDIENFIEDKYGYDADTNSSELENALVANENRLIEWNDEFYNDVARQINNNITLFSVEWQYSYYGDEVHSHLIYEGTQYVDNHDITYDTIDDVMILIMTDRYGLYSASKTPEEFAREVEDYDMGTTAEEFLSDWKETKADVIKTLEYIKYSLEHPVLG